MDAIQRRAAEIREQTGGTIFAFPVEEENPYSFYAVVVYLGGLYHVYPQAENVANAAQGVTVILEQLKKLGFAKSYENDVRFICYPAQINAPSTIMHQLKKKNGFIE